MKAIKVTFSERGIPKNEDVRRYALHFARDFSNEITGGNYNFIIVDIGKDGDNYTVTYTLQGVSKPIDRVAEIVKDMWGFGKPPQVLSVKVVDYLDDSAAKGWLYSDGSKPKSPARHHFENYASAKFLELKTALSNNEITDVEFDKKVTTLGHEIETKFHYFLMVEGKTEAQAKKMASKQRNDFFTSMYSSAKGKRLKKTNHINNQEDGDEISVGSKVKTKHGTLGEVIAIYEGKNPYVVRIIKDGMPHGSDYEKEELQLISSGDSITKGKGTKKYWEAGGFMKCQHCGSSEK